MMQALSQLREFTRFDRPGWLALGVVVALLLPVLYRWHDRRQRRALAAFAVERGSGWGLGVSNGLLWLRRGCVTGAALCGFIALAQPLGAALFQTEQERGLNILFAIDTSRSMLTPDVRPDRLTRAKLAVEDLLDQLGGDAVGLVAFAGEAFLVAPLTTDHDAFRETLESLDTRTIPTGGTDIASAIRLAQSTFTAHHDADPVVVLITDGEDLGGDAIAAAQAAGKAGIRIYTVGVGTAEGDLIPAPAGDGGERFVRDAGGQLVKSRLDEPALRQIAAATGGTYQPLGAQGQGVTELYQRTLSTLARHATAGRQLEVHAQLFQWPLGLAVLLLLIEWLVRPVRRHRSVAALAAAALGLLLALAPVPQARASAADEQYRAGAQAYRAKDYEAAAKAYRGALETTDVRLQQDAYYNLGNTLYREGSAAGRNPQQAIQNLKQALSAYDAALQLKPADADARFNRGVAQKKFDELQQQQQQRNSQQNQRNQQNQQGQQNQQNQQGQQGQQDPQGGQPQNPQQGGQSGDGQSQNRDQSQNQGRNQDPNQDQAQNQNQDRNGNQNPGSNPAQNRNPSASGPAPASDPGQRAEDSQAQQSPSASSAAQTGQPRQAQSHGAGEMTREEAERLLDSMRGQEHRVLLGGRGSQPASRSVAPLKDW